MAEQGQPSDMDTHVEDRALTVRRANRIMKIFGQVTECLEGEEVATIKQMLSRVIDLCRNKSAEEKPIHHLNKIYDEYLLMVAFRAGISVNLIKQSLRAFHMIEDDIEGLGKRVNDMFLEMILIEHPTIAIDMKLSDDLLRTYFRLLKEGEEEALHIRLMIVGMYGVGKSSLVRRLCHQNVEGLESTVGIDILLKTCEVDQGDWIISDDEKKERIFNMRLQKLVEKYDRKEDVTGVNFRSTENIQQAPRIEHNQQVRGTEETDLPQESIIIYERKNSYEEYRSVIDRSRERDLDIENDLITRTENKEVSDVKRLPTLSIWDFAGQSVYYSTHHFFLNDRSIYLLTLDLSKDITEKVEEENNLYLHPNLLLGSNGYTYLDAFRFWIKSIYVFTNQKEIPSSDYSRREYIPKIILIGTHKDKITKKQLNGRDYKKYKDDYFEKALDCFISTPVEKIVHPIKFLVNNHDASDEEFINIRKEIYELAKTMPFWKEKIPAKFIPLERTIFLRKKGGNKLMSLTDLKSENEKAVTKLSEKEIKLFLVMQHAFGNVIYFDAPSLQDTIILDPLWIVDVFKAFVTHKENKELEKMDKWKDFLVHGTLTEELIDELLKQKVFDSIKESIVSYMLHLDLVVRPVVFLTRDKQNVAADPLEVDESILGETSKSLEKENYYIVPCMLPAIPDLDILKQSFKQVQGEGHTPTICMYIKQGFLPPFVFHRIIATLLREKPIHILQGKKVLFNGLGSFSLTDDKSVYLSVWSWKETLHFRVSFPIEITKNIAKRCHKILGELEDLIIKCFNFHHKETFNKENISDLLVYRIKCPECIEQCPFEEKINIDEDSDYMCSLFSVDELRLREKSNYRKCLSCGKMVNIPEMLQFWFEDTTERSNDAVVKANCTLLEDTTVEEIKLIDIASQMHWDDDLICELVINEETVQRINARWNRKENPIDFRFRVLCEWKKKGEIWTKLYNAMEKVQMDNNELMRIIEGREREKDKTALKEKIDKLSKRDYLKLEKIDDLLIKYLRDCIGTEIWQLGIRLGIPLKRIDTWYLDCKDCDKLTQKILTFWKKDGSEIEKLFKAMIKSETDMPEVMSQIKKWCSIQDKEEEPDERN